MVALSEVFDIFENRKLSNTPHNAAMQDHHPNRSVDPEINEGMSSDVHANAPQHGYRGRLRSVDSGARFRCTIHLITVVKGEASWDLEIRFQACSARDGRGTRTLDSPAWQDGGPLHCNHG